MSASASPRCLDDGDVDLLHRHHYLNGGPAFRHTEAFSFWIATENQEETDRYWNAIVGKGGTESQCGWCKDCWDLSWQITTRALTEGTLCLTAAGRKRIYGKSIY